MNNSSGVGVESGNVERAILDKEDILKFTQTDYYLKNWKSINSGAGGFAGFNWMAFLFGSLWFFFRKMYLIGIAVMVLGFIGSMILPIILGMLQLELAEQAVTLSSYLSLFLFVRIPAGFLANKMYYKRTSNIIKEADDHGLTGDIRSKHLSKEGGTNNVIVIVFIVINWALNIFLMR